MSNIIVSTLDSQARFRDFSSQWNSLLEASTSRSVFLTWECLFAWSECCLGENRKLHVITFHRKEQLIGIAPFYIETFKAGLFTIRELRFLGTPEAGSDYLDVIAQKGIEKQVANALFDFLTGPGSSDWDQMALGEMPANSLFLLYFRDRIEKEGKYFEIKTSSYCPFASLDSTIEQYFAQVSTKRLQKIRQKTKMLNREGKVSHETFSNQTSDHVIADFFKFYEEKAGWSSNHVRPIIEKINKFQNNNLNIQVDFLKVDDQLVSGIIFLRYNNTLFQFLMFTDRNFLPNASVGILLILRCLENAINQGIKILDFLKGIEDYKFHWSTGGNCTLQLFYWQKKPSAICSAFTRLFTHAGKLILR